MSDSTFSKIEMTGNYDIAINGTKSLSLKDKLLFDDSEEPSVDWQNRHLTGNWLLNDYEIATKADITAMPTLSSFLPLPLPEPQPYELANATIVKNEAELQTALERGGTIIISGDIIISNPITFHVEGTMLYGINRETSRIIFDDNAPPIHYIIFTDKKNITLNNITIKGVNNTQRQHGIIIGRGSDGLTIKECKIETVETGIYMPGSEKAPVVRNVTIYRNDITDFCAGIYCSWGLQNWSVTHNNIIGDGCLYDPTKVSTGNAIWLGLGAHQLRVESNYCSNVQRMGIEVFWPYLHTVNPPPASLNQIEPGVIVSNNIVYNTGSMGISFGGARNSVVSNNSISNVTWIGLELVGDEGHLPAVTIPDQDTNMVVTGNSIKNVHAGMRSAGTPLKPNTVTIQDIIAFGVYSNTPQTCSLGVKEFNVTTPDLAYGTVGQPVRVYVSNDLQKYMDGTIQSYKDDILSVNITSIGPGIVNGSTVSNWLIRYVGTRRLTLNSSNMAWGCNELPITDYRRANTILKVHSISAPSNIMYAAVEQYKGDNTVVIKPINADNVVGAGFYSDVRATVEKSILGVSIDKINGVLFTSNTIDTISDGNTMNKYGIQLYFSKNATIKNNVLTKAGTRYILNNQSTGSIIRNNVFIASDTENVRLSGGPTAESLTQFGEELSSAYGLKEGFYNFGSSNCIFEGNVIRSNAKQPLISRVNGGAVYSTPFASPYTAYSSIPLRGNFTGDISNFNVSSNYPVLDYTQTWTGTSSTFFTGYSFNINYTAGGCRPDSQVVTFKVNNNPALYINSIGETVITSPFINGTIKTGGYGVRLGTSTDKLGFFGTTPVVKPPTVANATSTNFVRQFNQLLANLKSLGLN